MVTTSNFSHIPSSQNLYFGSPPFWSTRSITRQCNVSVNKQSGLKSNWLTIDKFVNIINSLYGTKVALDAVAIGDMNKISYGIDVSVGGPACMSSHPSRKCKTGLNTRRVSRLKSNYLNCICITCDNTDSIYDISGVITNCFRVLLLHLFLSSVVCLTYLCIFIVTVRLDHFFVTY